MHNCTASTHTELEPGGVSPATTTNAFTDQRKVKDQERNDPDPIRTGSRNKQETKIYKEQESTEKRSAQLLSPKLPSNALTEVRHVILIEHEVVNFFSTTESFQNHADENAAVEMVFLFRHCL